MDLLKSISLALALAVVSLSVSPTVRPSGALWAQMHMPHPTSGPEAPLGIPETRLGSGTSWLPDSSPMHASHFTLGAWTLMVHGSAFLQYDRQGGTRGEDQVALLDWAMLAASRSLAGGQLDLRGMLSTDPWGVGSAGYPLLLQTGESNRGVPPHDHQHPHDLFMEVAALYRRAVAKNLGASLYLAPIGGERPARADFSSLAGRNAHNVRSADRRRLHTDGERRGLLVQRPRAERRSHGFRLRWPPPRLVQRPDLPEPGAALEPLGVVCLPQEPGGAAPGRITAPVRGLRTHDAAVRGGRTVGERADLGRERPARLGTVVE